MWNSICGTQYEEHIMKNLIFGTQYEEFDMELVMKKSNMENSIGMKNSICKLCKIQVEEVDIAASFCLANFKLGCNPERKDFKVHLGSNDP